MTPEPIIDRDPEDEDVQHPESTGLCASEWCMDAALPGDDWCPNCLGDLERILEEFNAA